MTTALPPAVAALLAPDTYPRPPASLALKQTHISYVVLADDDVYKIKKPVRFAFLDFSSLPLRRHFCHEEVRLNRRLAPNVYLGVAGIVRRGDRYALGAEDDPQAVEYAVHMRRLPENRTLDRLLAAGAVSMAMVERIAERLAAFHAAATSGPEIAACGAPEAVWAVMTGNYTATSAYRNVTIPAFDDDAIQDFAARFLRRHDAALRRRQTAGRIRDCHGDLHVEHICFADELIVFDCIEFNPRLRYCDVASEVAFLAMDLDAHGAAELGRHFVAHYAAVAADPDIHELLPFYMCHRAYIRGQVDSMKAAQPEVSDGERASARTSAELHFALAYRYTWMHTPGLAVVAGLSGTGKSTVAARLAARTGWTHLNSDRTRKRLAGMDPTARPAPGADTERLYSAELSARTYRELFDAADTALSAGRGAVLDATFVRRTDRDTARELARRHGVPALVVECRCPDAEVRRRIDARIRDDRDASDATWAVYRNQQRHADPFGDDERNSLLPISTEESPEIVGQTVEQALRRTCERRAESDGIRA